MEFSKQACFYKNDIIDRHSATPLSTSQCLRYTILHIRILKEFAFQIYQLIANGIRRHTLNKQKTAFEQKT